MMWTIMWSVAFKEFRSALDKVNHSILFSKLQMADISLRMQNILKVLYNFYHFNLSGDELRRINLGVAQDSLVSPLLFDLYVDGLHTEVSAQFEQHNVF